MNVDGSLITVSAPATASRGALTLAVIRGFDQGCDGAVILGGLYVVDAGDDCSPAGQLGFLTGTSTVIGWTQDGYTTKEPSWAAEGVTLLRAFVSGDELPEGWEVVS